MSAKIESETAHKKFVGGKLPKELFKDVVDQDGLFAPPLTFASISFTEDDGYKLPTLRLPAFGDSEINFRPASKPFHPAPVNELELTFESQTFFLQSDGVWRWDAEKYVSAGNIGRAAAFTVIRNFEFIVRRLFEWAIAVADEQRNERSKLANELRINLERFELNCFSPTDCFEAWELIRSHKETKLSLPIFDKRRISRLVLESKFQPDLVMMYINNKLRENWVSSPHGKLEYEKNKRTIRKENRARLIEEREQKRLLAEEVESTVEHMITRLKSENVEAFAS